MPPKPNGRKRLSLRIGTAVGGVTLFEDLAPKTVGSLWSQLPLYDRAIHVRWSGNAWRTEQNHFLLPESADVENVAARLKAGDLIYYPGYKSGLVKIGLAYGEAQWLAPFAEPLAVTILGQVDENLDDLVAQSEQLLTKGALEVEITQL